MNLQRRLGLAATGMAILAATVATMALGSPAASAKRPRRHRRTRAPEPGAGLESDLRRDVRSRRTRRTRRASGSGPSSTRRSSMPTTGSSAATHRSSSRTSTANGESLVPPGASRRAAVVAAAYTALVGLFPTRATQLGDSYAAALAALSDDGGTADGRGSAGSPGARRWRRPSSPGARPTASARADPPFIGGTAVGQWRPIAPATSMSAQGLAFAAPFVVESNTQFRPGPPRGLATATYADDLDAVKALGRRTGSTRTDVQTELAPFWEGNASVHWNQAANQIARAEHLSTSESNRLLAVLNLAMADTAFTIWSAKRYYGADPAVVTWRPLTAITLADSTARDDAGSELAPARHDTVPPGVSGRPPGPERRRRDRPRESLRRRPDVHADDLAPAQPDVCRASRKRAPTATTPGSGAGCTTPARLRSAMPSARQSQGTSMRARCNRSTVGHSGSTVLVPS